MKSNKSGRIALRGGAYSLIISLVVLALVVVANLFAGTLPASLTKLDISSSQLYSVTSNTKVVVNALEEDVTIYWIVQSGQEDEILENLLAKYESLSSHIAVVKKNPDVFPTFAEQYTDETLQNNSLVVEAGERYRYVGYDDIYLQESDMYSYTYTTSFDGEGAITSAIDYVVSKDLPQLYVLEGHGEWELPATFADQVEKENMEINTLSLLTVEGVPEEADCLLIYSPESDISEDEKTKLADFVAGGGKLFVMAGPTEEDSLTNLYSLLADYGVEKTEGIVVEEDQNYSFYGYPYILLPQMNSHAITDSLIAANYYALLPLASGLSITGSSGTAIVTELLSTSDSAFSKAAGFALETYEKEEGDTDGPFALAVDIEDESGGEILWFASSDFLQDYYNAYASGANVDLAMNALSHLVGETEAVAIRSKSLNYNYLTISSSAASTLKILMIGVFPLTYLAVGVVVLVQRRRRQNETV